jgi:hypothetical protein
MELLSNETVREWLLCRSEPSLPATVVETAFPLRAYLQFDSFSVTCDYLVKPLGVVNGILLGYVLGDPYSFALSQNWGPMVHPACRRFVLNLETQEFLEVRWGFFDFMVSCLIQRHSFTGICIMTLFLQTG